MLFITLATQDMTLIDHGLQNSGDMLARGPPHTGMIITSSNISFNYFACERGSKYCDECVRLSVYPLAGLSPGLVLTRSSTQNV